MEALASICTILAIGLFVFGFIFRTLRFVGIDVEYAVDWRSRGGGPYHLGTPHQMGSVRALSAGEARRHYCIHEAESESPDLILVKRTIGIPGDRIHLRNGVVYLNGVAQNEPYAIQPSGDGIGNSAYQSYRDDFPSVAPGPDEQVTEFWREELPQHIQGDDLVVPPGYVFAMGDNRTESLDGRYWGFVPQQNILGRPAFVYWSFETPADQENKTSVGDSHRLCVPHCDAYLLGYAVEADVPRDSVRHGIGIRNLRGRLEHRTHR